MLSSESHSLQGVQLVINSINRIPNEYTSHFLSQPNVKISGAIQAGEPTKLFSMSSSDASPKSPTLALPSELMYMFSDLMSRCAIPHSCNTNSPRRICLAHFLMVPFLCSPCSRRNCLIFPQSISSVTNITFPCSNQVSCNLMRNSVSLILFQSSNSFLILFLENLSSDC